jgi:hypothetical protein
MAEEKAAPAKKVMGGKSKKKKSGKVKHMHIRHATSGGYIVGHDMAQTPGQPMQEPEEHAVPDIAALQSHVQEHMQEPPEQEQAPVAG